MNWAAVLGALTEQEDLAGGVAHDAMAEILAGEATSAQIAAFAIALRMKGETVDELTGLLQAMVEAADPVVLDRSVEHGVEMSRLIDQANASPADDE